MDQNNHKNTFCHGYILFYTSTTDGATRIGPSWRNPGGAQRAATERPSADVARFSPHLLGTTLTSRGRAHSARSVPSLLFQLEARPEGAGETNRLEKALVLPSHGSHERVPHRAAARVGRIRLRALLVAAAAGELPGREVLEREEGEEAEVGGAEGEVRWRPARREESRFGQRRRRGAAAPAPAVRPQPRRRPRRVRLRGLQQPTRERLLPFLIAILELH